jgi:hypothetical protein
VSQEKQQVTKKRKKKVSKAQTISARRRVDRARRERKRAKQKRKREEQRGFKFRVKVVRTYRNLKKQGSIWVLGSQQKSNCKREGNKALPRFLTL